MDASALTQRQLEIVEEVKSIRFMKKGSITYQQWEGKTRAGEKKLFGPYPLLTWKESGRSKSMRLKGKDEVAWAQTAIDNYHRFTKLCQEYEALGEQLAFGQRTTQERVSEEAQKKGLKSPRKQRRK